ncbi:hypothetical protein CDAR_576291 [Caerostris darwini]|uniref:Uncharacterized protein n=1 Tax=Caerostris darwini TaxID=1538125 RepID=A0AAV4Q8D3_9ARAC|nr:hypothetical protein CDAR_576291 [Caerostris darwini]
MASSQHMRLPGGGNCNFLFIRSPPPVPETDLETRMKKLHSAEISPPPERKDGQVLRNNFHARIRFSVGSRRVQTCSEGRGKKAGSSSPVGHVLRESHFSQDELITVTCLLSFSESFIRFRLEKHPALITKLRTSMSQLTQNEIDKHLRRAILFRYGKRYIAPSHRTF